MKRYTKKLDGHGANIIVIVVQTKQTKLYTHLEHADVTWVEYVASKGLHDRTSAVKYYKHKRLTESNASNTPLSRIKRF